LSVTLCKQKRVRQFSCPSRWNNSPNGNAMAEQIREILVEEQDHRIDLATALGEEVPDVSAGPQRRTLRKRR
jgi:bacterioferritin